MADEVILQHNHIEVREMRGAMWNLWHGCKKKSEGCKYCYVYRSDAKYERDASYVHKTAKFNLPISKGRNGEYKYPSGTLFWTCFTSDFLIEDADAWREEAWEIIKQRSDCFFFFITKRIERFIDALPYGHKSGYDNLIVGVTAENQKRVDERMPLLLSSPIKHKIFIHEPLLEQIDISSYLCDDIEQVVVGGESGYYARKCEYDWIMKIRQDCIDKNVSFHFKQTGANFVKDGKTYHIDRKHQHMQAHRANINYAGLHKGYI